VTWEPLVRGRADVSGIGPDARRAFSRRSAEIAGHLAARGVTPDAEGRVSRRAAHVAGLATRAPKELDIGADELRAQWRRRAQELGLGPRRLDAVLDRAPGRRGRGPGLAPDVAGDRQVADAVLSLRGDRSFTRRDVVRAWSGVLRAGAPSDEVAAVVDRFLDAVRLEQEHRSPGGERWRPGGPGVAETRHELPERLRRRELDVLLERRGMTRPGPTGRDRGRARAVERDVAELGMGLGLG
jgi:hypothetical protein